jgi:hypothetical protein
MSKAKAIKVIRLCDKNVDKFLKKFNLFSTLEDKIKEDPECKKLEAFEVTYQRGDPIICTHTMETNGRSEGGSLNTSEQLPDPTGQAP